jgi:predicted nucleic acid-binding protein
VTIGATSAAWTARHEAPDRTSVLGQLCHPRRYDETRSWFRDAVREHTFLVSEVADYELRRELLRVGSTLGIARLDELGRALRYVPVSTAAWRCGAWLWSDARNTGNVTAPPEALDGDTLIAAQAIEEGAAVLTTNTRHFDMLGVRAFEWRALGGPE